MIVLCGSRWGIGVSVDDEGEAISYGFPVTKNPKNFYPDHECCSDEEIKAHDDACDNYEP